MSLTVATSMILSSGGCGDADRSQMKVRRCHLELEKITKSNKTYWDQVIDVHAFEIKIFKLGIDLGVLDFAFHHCGQLVPNELKYFTMNPHAFMHPCFVDAYTTTSLSH